MASHDLLLFDASDGTEAGPVTSAGLDVFFPDHVAGWTDVLDCREGSYTSKSIAENCAFARRVNKKYILVEAEQVAQETPGLE
jgi:hypothetical protein